MDAKINPYYSPVLISNPSLVRAILNNQAIVVPDEVRAYLQSLLTDSV